MSDSYAAGHAEYVVSLNLAASAYRFRDETVVVDGGEIIVRSVIPVVDHEHETFPMLVHIHGGGEYKALRCFGCAWNAHSIRLDASGPGVGNIDLDDYFLRKLSVDLKLSTVNVKYR